MVANGEKRGAAVSGRGAVSCPLSAPPLFIIFLLAALWAGAAPCRAAAQGIEAGAGGEAPFPRLYLGLRAGAALDFQEVRASGGYEADTGKSAGGEGAVTAEFRPWRHVSFQAEGVFVPESFAPRRLREQDGLYAAGRCRGMYLLFPVLVKVSLGMDGLRLSPYAGACYVLPLGTDIGGVTYRVKAGLPLGVMAGFEIGGAPGGGKRGELYGSLRYGIDLGLFSAEGARLQYTRSRLVFSLGYRFGIGKRGEGNSE